MRRGSWNAPEIELDTYDRKLMTAVVDRAERLGKRVFPLIVPEPIRSPMRVLQPDTV